MEDFDIDNLVDRKQEETTESITSSEINKMILNLQLYSNNVERLTSLYTDILMDDNVVYIMTRISQNPIFQQHFPEFYEKNENGESVINCQQNSPYHKYGVFKHILYTIENVGKDNLRFSSHDMKILKWTMLLHDIGKPKVKTINSEGNDSFAGHDDESLIIADKIIDRFDFDEDDKKVIMTLIKYHDKYLNEGDLTYDNLTFLAKELEDKKELFYLLIEVKIADNKAKSIDVYNKFATVVKKYYDFANEYFNNIEDNKEFSNTDGDESIVTNNLGASNGIIELTQTERGLYKEGGSNEDITEDMIINLCKDITSGRKLKCYYQPIIDLKKKVVEGYEVFYKIITDEDFSYKQITKKAKEFDKYDKLQQMLFINALDRFSELSDKNGLAQHINIDARSYLKYVNKARIFDYFEKNNVVLEFNNFETLINSKIKELATEIQKRKGAVAIDNFESSDKGIKDIEQINPRVVKFRLMSVEENVKKELKELATLCLSESISLIVFGIDTKEKFELAKECSVRYVEGDYFSKPTEGLDMKPSDIDKILGNNEEDLIV